MWARLRIVHKGLLLACLLLVSELSFLLVLAQLLKESEIQVEGETRSRLVASQMNKLLADFYLAGSALAAYAGTRDAAFRATLNEHEQSIANDLVKLDDLTRADANARQHTGETEAVSKKLLAMLKDMRQRIDTGNISWTILEKQWGGGREAAFAELKALTRQTPSAKLDEAIQRLVYRQRVTHLIEFGIAFNVFAALLLAAAFVRGITSGLSVLIQNTRRFAGREELLPRLKGHDELAELDAVFRRMVKDLNIAEQKRSDFVAMLTHDLRSPLSSMQMSLELMIEGVYGDLHAELEQRVRGNQRTVGRLLRLVNDLLDVEKAESGLLTLSYEEVSLEKLARDAVESVNALAESHNVTVVVDVVEADVNVDGDRLNRALVNLLANAIKFSTRGEEVKLSAHADQNGVEIKVQDHGKGIPKQAIDKIFDRYEQVDNSGGTGLGLTICKTVIERHGGKITVNSEVGKGTTFDIWIPNRIPESLQSNDSGLPA